MSDRDEWDYGPFKVGDVVELCNAKFHPELNGSSVSIAKEIGECWCLTTESVVVAYRVSLEINGAQVYAFEGQVRRRKPPMTGLQDILAMFDKQPDRIKELA